MATRSRIGIENNNGTVSSIYCHWDGYPEHTGKILKDYYSDPNTLQQLLDLGDISFLKENLKDTIAYHRDKGEDLNPSFIHPDVNSFKPMEYEEYGYVLTKDNEWVIVETAYGNGIRRSKWVNNEVEMVEIV
jgi:hypothetical protein